MSYSTVLKPKKAGSSLKTWLYALGPGIFTAAVVFGPSKMTITSKMGAEYGYALLWIIVIAIFFMIVFTSMSARIGAVNKVSLLNLIRQQWGNKMAIFIGVGVFLVTTSFQAGNSIGVGIAVAEATGTDPLIWVMVFNLFGIGLLFFRSFYKILEKLMIFLVALMLFAFATTLFLVKPELAGVSNGFVPAFPTGSTVLIIAFTASCFSIVGAFYQSYLVQARAKAAHVTDTIENTNRSSITGIIILGIMSAVVMVCAAAVLHPKGIRVNSASEMGMALEPLFGSKATLLFLTGLFGASFSSLVGNATVGGTLLGDAMGFGSDMNSKAVKFFIASVMVAGAVIAVLFGKLPLQLIVFAQSVTIFLVPFIGFAMYMIANNESVMGEYKNSLATKIFGGLGLVLITGLAISSAIDLFNK